MINLFDGAIVKLRNGEIVTIRENDNTLPSSAFKWISNSGVHRRTWTKLGRYTVLDDDHPLDIICLADEEPIERTEHKRRAFITEEGRTADLYDGAKVTLRNGTSATLTPVTSKHRLSDFYVWENAENAEVYWDSFGRYFSEVDRRNEPKNEEDHPLDIVSVEARPVDPIDASLFDIVPYGEAVSLTGNEKFRLMNGETMSGLTLLGDEIFTSQRDFVWRRYDGCAITHDHQYDIAEVLYPKPPVALADSSLAIQINSQSPVQIPFSWSKPDDPDYKESIVYRTVVNVETPEGYKHTSGSPVPGKFQLMQDVEPKKSLVKLMDAICDQYGGTFAGYEWLSVDAIRFKVKVYGNKMRENGKRFSVIKTVTLMVSADDNNAMLPMKKVK